MPLGEAQRDDAAERVAEDVDRLVEQRDERVGEAAQARGGGERRRSRRGPGRSGTISRLPARCGAVGEVPGGPAEAVHKEERRPFPADEVADPGAAPVVAALLEAGQEVGRIRHVDGLWFGDCELDGDKAGRVRKLPGLVP